MVATTTHLTTDKAYIKEYYDTGSLKSEGWKTNNIKTGYWYFYHDTGQVASKGHFNNNEKEGYWYYYTPKGTRIKEGHYAKGFAENWWIFYDIANRKKQLFQYHKNQKNGFSLRYENNKLIMAEKYVNNKKEGQWTSIWEFKRDNPDASL
jgi:antitoxin component YwqK of YwqJK toxin-antitoxin module